MLTIQSYQNVTICTIAFQTELQAMTTMVLIVIYDVLRALMMKVTEKFKITPKGSGIYDTIVCLRKMDVVKLPCLPSSS